MSPEPSGSARRARRGWLSAAGVTLVELMIATAIVSVGILGLMGTFGFIQRGIQTTKEKTLAGNLAQEKIEALKDVSYYKLLATTATASDGNFNPAITYDVGPNGVETINVGGIDFERRVYIRKVAEGGSGDLTHKSWTDADTGLKEVLVYVVWKAGNEWKKLGLRNLRDNPSRQELNASFSGTVTRDGTATPIENATVIAMQNTSRYDTTDSAGNYSFSVEAGSYTLRASKPGYFVKYSGMLNATSANSPIDADFALVKMASGSLSGTAYLRDHLVISQVVASSGTQGGTEVEFVELYNPTTYAWTLDASTLELMYRQDTGAGTAQELDLTFIGNTLPPLGYFLIASTSPIHFRGLSRSADATYDSGAVQIADNQDGGLGIRAQGASTYYDRIAWTRGNNGDEPPEFIETEPVGGVNPGLANGLSDGEQLVRKSSSTGITAGSGRAYDSNDNKNDFAHCTTPEHDAHNSSITETLATGTPAVGAVVYADDGLSSGGTVDSSGQFALVSVATGTWTVVVSSGMLTQSVGPYGGASDAFSTTIPTTIYLTDSALTGYVSGKVTTITGSAIADILVEAGGGSDRTDASGNYLLVSSTGSAVFVTANAGDDNPLYIKAESNASFDTGQMATVNFSLSQGGEITGAITSNGVDPIPNIPVTASQEGVERGTGVSGSNGAFTISNLSTGTYAVAPQLESGESSTPASASVTVTGGGTASAGTFTISGALGYLSGSLTLGSLTGPAITTGVLIYASTATIASDPPAISSTTRSGSVIYYAASSFADGTYRVGVRGGSNYNIYAWHTIWSGDTPTTVRKSQTNVSVPVGATVDQDFFW